MELSTGLSKTLPSSFYLSVFKHFDGEVSIASHQHELSQHKAEARSVIAVAIDPTIVVALLDRVETGTG